MQTKPWHTLTVDEAFLELKSQPIGLSQIEVEKRVLEYGPNELTATHRISAWEILLEQFKNVLILIPVSYTHLTLPTSDLV